MTGRRHHRLRDAHVIRDEFDSLRRTFQQWDTVDPELQVVIAAGVLYGLKRRGYAFVAPDGEVYDASDFDINEMLIVLGAPEVRDRLLADIASDMGLPS